MLHYQTIPVTPFQQNCSLLWCDVTHDAAIIDPGGEIERLLAAAARLGVTIRQIWITHAHIDHAGGSAELAARLGIPIIGPHRGDQFWIDALPEQGTMFGLPRVESFTPSRWLEDGDTTALVTHRGMSCSIRSRCSAPSSAMCCLPAPSGAPTFRRAITRR